MGWYCPPKVLGFCCRTCDSERAGWSTGRPNEDTHHFAILVAGIGTLLAHAPPIQPHRIGPAEIYPDPGDTVYQTMAKLINQAMGKVDKTRCVAHSDNTACYDEDHLIPLEDGGDSMGRDRVGLYERGSTVSRLLLQSPGRAGSFTPSSCGQASGTGWPRKCAWC